MRRSAEYCAGRIFISERSWGQFQRLQVKLVCSACSLLSATAHMRDWQSNNLRLYYSFASKNTNTPRLTALSISHTLNLNVLESLILGPHVDCKILDETKKN